MFTTGSKLFIGATLTYGLLPRLGLWLAARLLRRRALFLLPLDDAAVERVLRRRRPPRTR